VNADQNTKGAHAEPEIHAACQTVGINDEEICLDVSFDRHNKPLNATSLGGGGVANSYLRWDEEKCSKNKEIFL
jgi:hypothetical protein